MSHVSISLTFLLGIYLAYHINHASVGHVGLSPFKSVSGINEIGHKKRRGGCKNIEETEILSVTTLGGLVHSHLLVPFSLITAYLT